MTRRRGRHAAGAVAISVAVTLGLGIGTPVQAGTALGNPSWSGYMALACGTCSLRYVTATWVQPSVNCADSPLPVAWATSWVGLDGWEDESVEQIGTYTTCTDGNASYLAFYEMYPANPVMLYSVPIAPGDLITASVYYDAAAGRWRLTVSDRTTGARASTSQPCPPGIFPGGTTTNGPGCGNISAEVIAEVPGEAGANLPLADFGTETYTAIAVTSRNGTHGSMETNRLWAVHPVDLIGATGTVLASPGLVRAGGTAFTDIWQAAH